MKKSLLYIFPILPFALLYGFVYLSNNSNHKQVEVAQKVKILEQKISSFHALSTRRPANSLPKVRLSKMQVEHLIRFKGCKVFQRQGQNMLTCPEQSKAQKRFI